MIRHGTSANAQFCKRGPYNLRDNADARAPALAESTTASDMSSDSSSLTRHVTTGDRPEPANDSPLSGEAFAHERAARVRAESQVFSRDQVLSTASHDLRGPLNAIHTWAHVLERKLGEADASVGRALAGIRAGVEQQVALIEKIIDAPRMATRHLAITRQPVALKPLCEDVVANARLTQGSGDIEIEWHGEAREGDVDGERIWQAWWCMLAYASELSAAANEATAAPGARLRPRVLRMSSEQGNCVATLTTAAPTLERAVLEQHLALPRRVAEAHGGLCSIEAHEASHELTISMVIPLANRG